MANPVLITGANGLLGRALVARLASYRDVYALARSRLSESFGAGVVAIEHDLRQQEVPRMAETPDTIVHLAQSPRHRDFPDGALDVFEVNTGSTQRLLDWAGRHGVKRFIYASTGSVYGHGQAALSEDAPVPDSLGHYAASKRCGELLAAAYRERMVVIVLRFFTIYGPGQRADMLIPRLVNNVMLGRPIVLQGESGARFNPIYVDDAAAAVDAATGLAMSETINIAGPQVLSLREIGDEIGNATSRVARFEVQSGATPMHLVGDTAKMRRVLVSPRIAFAEGVNRLVADRAAGNAKHVLPN